MSYTHVGNAQNYNAAVAITVSAGDLVVVSVSWNDSTSTPAVPTDGLGNTYTLIGYARDTFAGSSTGVYQSIVTTGGSASIFFPTPPSGPQYVVNRYTGLVASSVSVTNYMNGTLTTATDALTSTTLTPGSQPGMLFAAGYVDSSQVLASGTGFTNRTPAGETRNFYVEDAPIASVSAVAATFTYTAGTATHGIVVAAYFAESGPPASYPMSSEMYF